MFYLFTLHFSDSSDVVQKLSVICWTTVYQKDCLWPESLQSECMWSMDVSLWKILL